MATEPGVCGACETPLAGRYCHVCGQDSQAKPAPLLAMAKEVAASYSLIDGKLARTLAVLAVRPGRLLEAYRAGAGSLYITPLKLFVATTALFLAVLHFSDIPLYQSTWKVVPGQPVVVTRDPHVGNIVTGAVEQLRWLQKRIEPAVDPAVTLALQQAAAAAKTPAERTSLDALIGSLQTDEKAAKRMSDWLPNLLWLLMPLYATLLIPLFGRRRLFLEHVIFAMWAHSISFVLMMIMAGINSLGADLAPLLILPYLAYFTVAAARYYEMSPISALWRGAVHLAAYALLVLLPTVLAIMMTVADWGAILS